MAMGHCAACTEHMPSRRVEVSCERSHTLESYRVVARQPDAAMLPGLPAKKLESLSSAGPVSAGNPSFFCTLTPPAGRHKKYILQKLCRPNLL